MFSVTDRPSATPRIALADETAGSRAEVAPSRGGMAVSFFARGREWMYLDARTLDDASQNVRGGAPVLFPSPGKLAGDAWSHAGRSGHMKQHGFARNRAWRERGRGTAGAASVLLELCDDADSRAQFPWPFRTTLRYALAGETLRIDIAVENRGDAPLPFAYGFHPYFAVPQAEKARARIPTPATRAWDNVRKLEVPMPALELASAEVDLHLIDHGGSAARLELAAGAIALRGSPEFSRWVIWTVAGKDFICLEPWTAPGDALNSGAGLIELAPGARRELWLELTAD